MPADSRVVHPASDSIVKEVLEESAQKAGGISAGDAGFTHAMLTNKGVEHRAEREEMSGPLMCQDCNRYPATRIPGQVSKSSDVVITEQRYPKQAIDLLHEGDLRALCSNCYANLLEDMAFQESHVTQDDGTVISTADFPLTEELPPVENAKQEISTNEYPPVAEFPPVDIPVENQELSPVENVTKLSDWKQKKDEPEIPPVENAEKRKRGRPRKVENTDKPFAPPNYEWRSDSGGWKFVYRPAKPNGKKGYDYIGFLSADRWNYFKRFNDEKFIAFVGRFFEQRKARSIRAGRLGQAG